MPLATNPRLRTNDAEHAPLIPGGGRTESAANR